MATIYRQKAQTYEAMQYDGTNVRAAEMVSWAPSVLSQNAARKLVFTPEGFTGWEVVPTTWIIEQVGFYENVRDQYFHKLYEEVLP